MKHFSRLMGQLCPLSNLYKTKLSAMVAVMSLFMCLIAAKQVSAQSEPAAAAGVQSQKMTDTVASDSWGIPRVVGERFDSSREEARIPRFFPDADLERFPLLKYQVVVDDSFGGLGIGDTIPDELWDMPLWVVNHSDGRDTTTLREYERSKLLILDFWASWCAPCVASMDKWEEYTKAFDGDVDLLGVHIDFDYKALPFLGKRGWRSATVVGGSARSLNHIFFDRDVVSRMVWIRGGVLIAITGTKGYDASVVRDVINGKPVEMPMADKWTYSTTKP